MWKTKSAILTFQHGYKEETSIDFSEYVYRPVSRKDDSQGLNGRCQVGKLWHLQLSIMKGVHKLQKKKGRFHVGKAFLSSVVPGYLQQEGS